MKKRIGIVGGGPSGLFMYKRLIESGRKDLSIDIFEASKQLGRGMPYSIAGANKEHITNVSGNEIPHLVTSTTEWLKSLSADTLSRYNLNQNSLTEYSVFPRLLFGEYLNAQFELLRQKADAAEITTSIHLECPVTDIIDNPGQEVVTVEIADKRSMNFDKVIMCTGHTWPVTHEGNVDGYYDSPYPPSKLALQLDHPVAIRGSSLTAIDAVRTLARRNGEFIKKKPHKLSFKPHADSKNFKIILHSRHGLLPAIRFHLQDPHLSKTSLVSREEIEAHMSRNQGFLSLDFIFEKDFKEKFIDKDPAFYARIKDLSLEDFVEMMMALRENADPFLFFKAEYLEAKNSIRRQESVYWKEMLAILSFALNYPAKHLSAEDMQRLQEVLMPLIAIVIAFVPQSSCEELIALHEAGKLELLSVGKESKIEIDPKGGVTYHLTTEAGETQSTYYKTFIDCIGQRHLTLDAFPFAGLVRDQTVSPARLKFRSSEIGAARYAAGDDEIETDAEGKFYLMVPGIAINDQFRIIAKDGSSNSRLYIMAVPYIGGYNPDYSGLDFCEEASKIIADDILPN
jgi:uncharacterized NAD(P)/FAD-binding protein YdhS